ncbi:MAG TPA: hypothetical protein VK927_09830, partial [Adhaeribacter sp.]|nr:hypothetical protein [Adhaeribacter sp.]
NLFRRTHKRIIMKNSFIPLLLLLFLTVPSFGQMQEDWHYTQRGDAFVIGSFARYQRNHINNGVYASQNLELGAGYYLLNRLGLKASVSGQNFRAQETLFAASRDLHRKNLWAIGGQVRYHFLVMPGFATMFLQSGYSLGRFRNFEGKHYRNWEMISYGQAIYLGKAGLPRFGIEMGIGLEQNNLSNRLNYPARVGLLYYISAGPQKKQQTANPG